MKKTTRFTLFVVLALILSACGAEAQTAPVTAMPIPKPEPVSTETSCLWYYNGSAFNIPRGGVEIGYYDSGRHAIQYVSCEAVREEPILTDTELISLQTEENGGYAIVRAFAADGNIEVHISTTTGPLDIYNGTWVKVKRAEGGYFVDYGDLHYIPKGAVVFTAE